MKISHKYHKKIGQVFIAFRIARAATIAVLLIVWKLNICWAWPLCVIMKANNSSCFQKYPVNNKFLWAEWVIMPDGNSQITSAVQIYSVGRRLQPILLNVIFMTENSDQSITAPFNYFGKNVTGVTPKMTKNPPIWCLLDMGLGFKHE